MQVNELMIHFCKEVMSQQIIHELILHPDNEWKFLKFIMEVIGSLYILTMIFNPWDYYF